MCDSCTAASQGDDKTAPVRVRGSHSVVGAPRGEAPSSLLLSCLTVKSMSHSFDPRSIGGEAAGAGGAPTQSDRALFASGEPQREHVADDGGVPPRGDTRGDTRRDTAPRTSGTSTATASDREAALLELVARLRLVPFALARQVVVPGLSRRVFGRLVSRLVQRGLLSSWVEPTAASGSPRWLLATSRGRAAGLDLAIASAEGTVAERLASTMLPSERSRPLELAPRVAPPFLRHQKETATLLVRIAEAYGAVWYSAWDRPLPQGGAPFSLPQPDGVLVLPGAAGPELVFLEHDRGMESPAHFVRAKAERYAQLAVRPDLCQRLFAFPTFRLAVTVENFRLHRLPLERLTLLERLLRQAGASREARLTLAGWANWWPAGAVWCRADDPFQPIERNAAALQDPSLRHTLLCPALRPGDGCACRAHLEPPSEL